MSRDMKVNLIANTSQFKSAMTESSNQMKLINSEFKSAAAETDKYGNRLDQTGAKTKQLSGLIEQHRVRIQAIKNEQRHWTSELKKGNITETEHAQKQAELARRLNNTEAEMKKYQGQLKRMNAEGKAATRTYADFDRQFRNVGRTMRNVGAQVGITAGIGFMAMKRVLGDVVNEAKDFHAQMSEVKAISGATGSEMEKLTQQSKDLGRQTKFTAQEAAESQAELARAGFEVNEIYDAMPGLLDLAASSNLELGQSAKITSNIIRGFNKDAKESGHIADVLAKGAATANTDVAGLGQAMETAAPVANSLDIAFESVAASAGLMADAGIDGSKSGRMLRQGMLRLSKPTGQAADLIKDLGINAFDADGNMKSLDGVVAELEKGLKGQSKQAKAAALATIFGSESTAGWTVLLEQGSDELKNYTTELENSDGAAKDMADTMMDNAEGAIVRMQSALSGLKIELGEKLLPILGAGADFIGDLANKMAEMDDATAQTIAETALLVTAVLGVTTAVAGLVAGIGAFMAFAGPVGLAIAGGTLLLGGLAAAIYKNKLETEKLKEEQEVARQEAIRYGDGLSEGTRKGVKGYVDLYEGAKLEMHKLKDMSGKEAEKTKNNVIGAFKDMGDLVIQELEDFANEFDKVVKEIYGVYEDEGEKRANEIAKEVKEDTEKIIKNYEGASKRIAEIIDEFGANVEEYPPKIRESYEKNMAIMEQGVGVFANTYEEALAVRNRIAENKDKILFEESQKYASEIEKAHSTAQENINDQYNEQKEIIEQFKIIYPENAEVYDEMMKTLHSSTTQEYAKIDKVRADSTRELYENTNETGKLIDFQTGKELERGMVTEEVATKHGLVQMQRAESDEEYYRRYVKTNEDYLNSLDETSERSMNKIEENAYEWAISMGKTEEESRRFAKEIREGTLEELSEGDEKAKKSGKDKGDAHASGIESTNPENEQSADFVTQNVLKKFGIGENESNKHGKDKGQAHGKGVESTKGFNIRTTQDIVNDLLGELGKGDGDAKSSGTSKGTAHKTGLDGTRKANISASSLLSNGVTSILSRTTDGGGGRSAGSQFSAGVRGQSNSASSAGTSVARSGESGLRSVSTVSAGTNFVSGFKNQISSGRGVWSAAWSLGKSALSALRSSIKTASPSKETEEIGHFFGEGFINSISASVKDSRKSAEMLGRESLDALSGEIENYKHSFAKLSAGIEQNKQKLVVEHSLSDKFNEFSNMLRQSNDKENSYIKSLLTATLEQNQILMQLLAKNPNIVLNDRVLGTELEPIVTEIQNRNNKIKTDFK